MEMIKDFANINVESNSLGMRESASAMPYYLQKVKVV